MGPLLFVLYCADIAETVKGVHITQYADDVTLTVTAETVQEVMKMMNAALAAFVEYATGNRMAAEPTKTQLIKRFE